VRALFPLGLRILTSDPDERSDAWKKRRLYFECSVCNHAKTEPFFEEGQRE